jgi:FkbM family methyltransferase
MTFAHDYDLEALKLIQPLGQQFRLHVTPRFVWRYEQKEYEAYTARLLAKFCERASVFVDVGAHYGFFSLLAASRWPKLRVIAAEPARENFDILSRNIQFNQFDNIEPLNLAVSDHKGIRFFQISSASDNCSFYVHPATPTLRTDQVQVATIDSMLASTKPGPIVFKVDVEGNEFAVLDGMKRTLKRFSDIALFVEFNPEMIEVSGRRPSELLQRLESLGFAIFLLDDEKQRHYRISSDKDWAAFCKPDGYANLVCLPRAHALNAVFVSHLAGLGGAERCLLELVDEWMTDHWTLATVLCPADGPLTNSMKAIGAAVVVAPFEWWCHADQIPADANSHMARSANAIVQNLTLFRDIDPDLIWTQSIVIPWGSVLAAFLRKPHIWSICEWGERDHRLKFYMPFSQVLKIVDVSSNFIFSPNPAIIRELFPQLDSGRADFIYPYIRVPVRQDLKPGDAAWTMTGVTRIAAFGTLQSGKGQEDLIRAVGRLTSRGRRIELLLAGDAVTSYRKRLQLLAKRLRVSKRVVFTGFIDNPYPTMATADIVVSCARQEAFGLSLVEAMLLERAVVYAGAGGPLDYMADGITGLSYPPGDPEKLAAQLERLIASPARRKKLGQHARAQAQKLFSRAGYGEKAFARAIKLRGQPAHLVSTLGDGARPIFETMESLALLLGARADESNQLLQGVRGELAAARSRATELENTAVAWSNEAQGLQHGVQVWSKQAHDLEADRATIRSQLLELQGLFAEKSEELNRELSARATQLAELQELFAKKSEEFDRELGAREIKIETLTKQIKDLEHNIQVWSQQASELEANRAALNRQLAEQQVLFKEKSEEFNRELGARKIQIETLTNLVKGLEHGVQVWSKQARDLEADRSAIGAELTEAQGLFAKKTDELNHKLRARDNQIEDLTNQAKSLRIGVEAWSKQASDLESVCATITERLAEQEASFVKKSEEVNLILRARDDHIKALSDHTKGLEIGVQVWSKEARALEADRAIVKQQLAEQQALLQKANEELSRVYRSRSWRLMLPLRAIRRYFAALPLWAIDCGLGLYRIAPLPPATKMRIKSALFTIAPALARRVAADHPQQGVQNASAARLPSIIPSPVVASAQRSDDLKGRDSPLPICTTPLWVTPPARVIAFYLPQFHPIPENDEFWGKGFTEWTNVRRAKPQFEGHYQPRLPGDLGFYDLRHVDVQRRQVELAKLYGIGGFCFYLYWFNGRRLLETPLEQYLTNEELDLPFCLCWANENWTRSWDGLTKEILVEQHHSPQDDIAFIQHLARYLADPRYIRINGRPLVIVYRPSLLPAAADTAERWRSWCRQQGIGEIYLAYVQSFESDDPAKFGFDAAIEFPPNNLRCPLHTGELKLKNPLFSGKVFDWEFFVRRSEQYQPPLYPLFRGVNPSWDNEARRPGQGTIMIGSSPELYGHWLENALRDTVARFDDASERLVFVNAWNEWAEGAYLEPDGRYGYAYLQATRNAIENVALEQRLTNATRQSGSGIIVVGHDAHPHGAQFLALNILRELRQVMGFDAECLLLRDGSLTPAYAEIGPTHELHGYDPESSEAISMIKSLARRGFHTALCNTTASGHFVPLLKVAGFRVVSLVHELPQVLENYEGTGLKRHAQDIAVASDTIVFPGELVTNGFRKFASFEDAKTTILPQGLYKRNRFRTAVDIAGARLKLRQQLGLAADTRVILSVAFGDRRKGIDLFIDIGERLLAEMPNTAMVWAGNIDEEIKEEITSRVARSRYFAHFVFPGFIADTDPLFAGADLYALTSREDPFPSVILEAFEVMVPVVAFKGTGAFEQTFLTHNVGRLAAPFDTDAFAQELKRLLRNEIERSAMGRAGSDLVKNEFSFRKYVYDLMTIARIPVKRVSIIVPNYNYCRYLEARLRSISNQTIPPYEVIVIDDASTDKSREWLDENLEKICPGAELFYNEKNSGSAFIQWLSGVRRARGEYVWIAEADDVADPNFLSEVLAKFDDPDVVLSFCQSKQMDSHGQILCNHYLNYVKDISPTKWTEPYVNIGVDEIISALSVKNTIPNVSAVVFKRDVLLPVLEAKLAELMQFRVAGDWITYIEVLRRGNIAFSPRSLNLHRRHMSGITMSSFDFSQLREIMSVQQRVREEFKPPDAIVDLAASYSEKLFEQFGLASTDVRSVRQHPELSKLLPPATF